MISLSHPSAPPYSICPAVSRTYVLYVGISLCPRQVENEEDDDSDDNDDDNDGDNVTDDNDGDNDGDNVSDDYNVDDDQSTYGCHYCTWMHIFAV